MGLFKRSYCANCGKQVAGYTKFVRKNGKLLYYLCMDCEEKYKRITNGSNHYPDTPAEVQAVISGRIKSFNRSDSDPLEPADDSDHTADKKKDLLVLLGCIAALVLGFLLMKAGESSVGAILMVPGLLLFIPAIRAYLQDRNRETMRYDGKTCTLFLLNRSPDAAKAIKIVADEDLAMRKEEEQLHYASATVGGITTGGFYTTGGGIRTKSLGKTGFFRLEFEGHDIWQIQLNDALYEQAKRSALARYLNEKKQIEVKISAPMTDEEVEQTLITYEASGMLTNKALNKGRPTREKCQAILDWMCGKNG